jgi:hypothetical protein
LSLQTLSPEIYFAAGLLQKLTQFQSLSG